MSHDKLLGNVLNQFENGCQLDLRAKLAVEFLKSPGFIAAALEQLEPDADKTGAHLVVEFSYLVAHEFIEQGRAREFIHAMPEGDALSGALKDHIERSVRANLYQGEVMEKEQRRRMPQVMQPPPGLVLPPGADQQQ